MTHLFEAEFVSAGLTRVGIPFPAAIFIYASARTDVLAATRGTLNGPPQPGRCAKDTGEAVPLVCKRTGGELAVPLQPIPPRLDCPKIRLVFIDVIGDGHCGSPKLG